MFASPRRPLRCPRCPLVRVRVLVPVWMMVLMSIARGGAADVLRLVVKEGSDVVLPCSFSGEDLTRALFDWKGVGLNKEVFLYDAGIHYNNGRPGQDQQVKGRVSHFEDELKNGNASIKITDAKVTDSGTYTCDFPYLETMRGSSVELVVEHTLKNRSGVPGPPIVLIVVTVFVTVLVTLAIVGLLLAVLKWKGYIYFDFKRGEAGTSKASSAAERGPGNIPLNGTNHCEDP